MVFRLAILGAGSVRCTPKTVGALATYFGERPMEIRMWDSDSERLDLFDSLARQLFLYTTTPHRLISTSDPYEALEKADAVIFQIGANCARKHRGDRRESDAEAIRNTIAELSRFVPEGAEVLSLQKNGQPLALAIYRQLNPSDGLTQAEQWEWAFQVLRWLRSEEYPFKFLEENEDSPIKAWLDNPSTAPLSIS